MTRPNFQIAMFISATLAACTIILGLASSLLSTECNGIAFTKQFHIKIWSRFSFIGAAMFYNADYPYTGSIIGITNDKFPPANRGWIIGNYGFCHNTDFDIRGKACLQEWACDLPGIYFRYFRWPDKPQPLWTLAVSFWYPLLLFSMPPAIWIVRRRNLKNEQISPTARQLKYLSGVL